jgi:uncharacterized protein (DUF1778 family)
VFTVELMPKPQIKNANVMMRTTPREKRLIEKAAALAQRAVSEYCRMQVVKAAEADIAAAAAKASEPNDTSVAVAQTD